MRLITLSLSDRLTKPIDLSMTTIEQTSSIFPTTTSMNFFPIKNMIELTVANTRLREKQLENEISKLKTRDFFEIVKHLFYLEELKNEITKEQDWKQKLKQDFLQLQRVRSIKNLFKKKIV
jgi:hypothetical protein